MFDLTILKSGSKTKVLTLINIYFYVIKSIAKNRIYHDLSKINSSH